MQTIHSESHRSQDDVHTQLNNMFMGINFRCIIIDGHHQARTATEEKHRRYRFMYGSKKEGLFRNPEEVICVGAEGVEPPTLCL